MMELEQRKINVEAMDDEQLEKTIKAVSEKITKQVDGMAKEINKTLSRYGLSCKLGLIIEQASDE